MPEIAEDLPVVKKKPGRKLNTARIAVGLPGAVLGASLAELASVVLIRKVLP